MDHPHSRARAVSGVLIVVEHVPEKLIDNDSGRDFGYTDVSGRETRAKI